MEFNLNNEIAKRATKTVYKDNGKTIKLFVENYSKADILNEALNQARVEEGTDLYMPKLLAVENINNRWALVSEHIDGTPLDILMAQNPEKEDEYLNTFVDIQLTILSKQVPLLNRIKDKFRRKIKNLKTKLNKMEANKMQNEKKELLKKFKAIVDDLMDHYEEYTDEEKAQIKEIFQKTAELNTILDKYDIEMEFDWNEYIVSVGRYFSTINF